MFCYYNFDGEFGMWLNVFIFLFDGKFFEGNDFCIILFAVNKQLSVLLISSFLEAVAGAVADFFRHNHQH